MTGPADLAGIVSSLLRQVPQWIRSDLASKDAALRERAEDALAAMITAAIAGARRVSFDEPRRH
jgi:hypothetical protein